MYAGERLNAYTHLAGAVLAVAGTVVLVVMAAWKADTWRIVSFAIYGATLVLLYVASTLYHGLEGRAKQVLRRLDHCSIYLLIAGTYTPFTLVTLGGPWGWSLFGVVWGLAVAGIVLELWLPQIARWAALALYLLMGWLAVVAAMPLLAVLGWQGFAWLAAGGVLYSAGIVFYVLGRKVPRFHAVWHLFVLAGSATHFSAVVAYVA